VYDLWGNETRQTGPEAKVQLTGRPTYIEGLDIAHLRQVRLDEAEIVLESVEAAVTADVGEKNVREHTSSTFHGQRRVMGLPEAGDAITWTMPPTLPPGLYDVGIEGLTGRNAPGTDVIGSYKVTVTAGGASSPLRMKAGPEAKIVEVRQGGWYGLMSGERQVELRPGDQITLSADQAWVFVGPLLLRRVKAAEGGAPIIAPRVERSIEPDGVEAKWAGATWLKLDRHDQVVLGVADRFASTATDEAWKGPKDCSARIALAWRPEGLAVFVDVTDDKIVVPAPEDAAKIGAFEADCVEVFLDAREGTALGTSALGEGVYQIFCPAPQPGAKGAVPVKLSWRVPPGAKAMARVTEKGYCVEIVVPRALAAGRRLGFDVAVDDADEMKDGRPVRKAQLVYHGTANDFQDPSAYAAVVVGK
jgi:hypothetical protein